MSEFYSKKSVFSDTALLAFIHFLNFISTIIILKILISVIGTHEFGKLVFVQAIINYSVWLVQWSAPFNGTPNIAKHSNDRNYQMRIFYRFMMGNLIIAMVFSVILVIAFSYFLIEVNTFSILGALLFLFATALSPIWFLHGQNKLVLSSSYQFILKLLTLGTIAYFLSADNSYHFYLFIVGLINFSGVLIMNTWIWKKSGVKIFFPSIADLIYYFKDGSKSCFSSTAINTQTALSPIILSEFSSMLQVGAFGAIERVRGLCVQISHPIMQTLFPKISYLFSKDRLQFVKLFRFVRNGIVIFYGILCMCLAFLSEHILMFFGGAELMQFTLEMKIMCAVIFLTIINEYYLYQRLYAAGSDNIAIKSKILGLFVCMISSIILVEEMGALGSIISILFAEVTALFVVIMLLSRGENE